MSKLNSDKISFTQKDFLVALEHNNSDIQEEAEDSQSEADKAANEIINAAKVQADKIIEEAKNNAQSIISEAKAQAEKIIEEGNVSKNEILTNAQMQIENQSQEAANKGYEEGYKDAQVKFFEEQEEKIKAFEEFCSQQNIVRDKILKNASREILNIIQNISKTVLLKEIDGEVLDKIIKKTISMFDKKEDIVIILSEKYAKLLYEFQKKEADIELNFDDFKKYKGFEVIYNKELSEDTIIVENPKERFCASILSQLDKITREIMNNTQNGNLETEEYDETQRTE